MTTLPMALRSQQFQIQILTAETVYRKDRKMFLQENQMEPMKLNFGLLNHRLLGVRYLMRVENEAIAQINRVKN